MRKRKIYKTRKRGALLRQLPPMTMFRLTTLIIILVALIVWGFPYVENLMSPPPPYKVYEIYRPEVTIEVIEISRENGARTVSDEECAQSINNLLSSYPGSPWRDFGMKFVTAAKKIQPVVDENSDYCEAAKLAVAIGCVESSCGKHHTYFNAWGLRDYTGKYKWERFSSWDNAIETYTRRTYRPYLQHGFDDFPLNVYCQSACTYYRQTLDNFKNKMR